MSGDTVRKSPCASCPYRRDVPSGVWAASEYDKLTAYDGDGTAQAMSEGGLRAFGCHQADGQICAGWAGHRDPRDLIAMRLGVSRGAIDPDAMNYTTSVPLFASGAEAAGHGKRGIEQPDAGAVAATSKIIVARDARGIPVEVDFSPAAPGPDWEWPDDDIDRQEQPS